MNHLAVSTGSFCVPPDLKKCGKTPVTSSRHVTTAIKFLRSVPRNASPENKLHVTFGTEPRDDSCAPQLIRAVGKRSATIVVAGNARLSAPMKLQ